MNDEAFEQFRYDLTRVITLARVRDERLLRFDVRKKGHTLNITFYSRGPWDDQRETAWRQLVFSFAASFGHAWSMGIFAVNTKFVDA